MEQSRTRRSQWRAPRDGQPLGGGKRPPLADTVLRLLVILLAVQDVVELKEIVPAWPEADVRQIIGHGPRSRVRRRQLDMSVAEVAAAAGVSEPTLSRFERNTSATPTLVSTKTNANGDEVRLLRNKRLARALRFVDLADHEKFCAAEDWLTWPVHPQHDLAKKAPSRSDRMKPGMSVERTPPALTMQSALGTSTNSPQHRH